MSAKDCLVFINAALAWRDNRDAASMEKLPDTKAGDKIAGKLEARSIARHRAASDIKSLLYEYEAQGGEQE